MEQSVVAIIEALQRVTPDALAAYKWHAQFGNTLGVLVACGAMVATILGRRMLLAYNEDDEEIRVAVRIVSGLILVLIALFAACLLQDVVGAEKVAIQTLLADVKP